MLKMFFICGNQYNHLLYLKCMYLQEWKLIVLITAITENQRIEKYNRKFDSALKSYKYFSHGNDHNLMSERREM